MRTCCSRILNSNTLFYGQFIGPLDGLKTQANTDMRSPDKDDLDAALALH